METVSWADRGPAPRLPAAPLWATSVEQVWQALRWIPVWRVVLQVGAAVGVLFLIESLAWPFWPVRWALWASALTWLLGGWRWWHVHHALAPDRRQVALWLEEHGSSDPDFSLVTATELGPEAVTPALARAATARVAGVPLAAALWRARRTAWMGPLLLLIGSLAVRALPMSRPDRSVRAAIEVPGASGAVMRPLGSWRVHVRPPAYAARPAVDAGDAALVPALPGSVVAITGEGPPPVADGPVPVRMDTGAAGWTVRVMATASPLALRFTRGGRTRQLLVEPVPDSTPRLQLRAPVRDTVFRTATGSLRLEATVHDDIGLGEAAFDLLVTSGEGERFTVRSVRVASALWRAAGAPRSHTMRATLALASLGLGAGDVVHLRAIARDHQPDTLRRWGSSETRAFRIARATEYDSVAVEAAAPLPVDSSRLSQRMLLLLTEKLDARQRRMARGDVVRESGRLARDQGKLRQQIGDLVFQRLSGESPAEHAHSVDDGHAHGVEVQGGRLTALLDEGNDAPVMAVNQPLLEAYNAMWDAGRALEIGDPHGAIPAMRRALLAIEKARAASRVYLRGTPPRVILDLARIRLVGRDTGRSAPRPSRDPIPSQLTAFDARLVRALRLAVAPPASAASDPGPLAARDSLAALRLDALTEAPAFAAAVDRLLAAMARGGEVTDEALAARRTLGLVDRVPVSTWSRMPGGTAR